MKLSHLALALALPLLFPSIAAAQTGSIPAPKAGSIAPANELPYDELMQKAEDLLKPQPPHNISFDNAAYIVFHRAARVAPDDQKKFEALMRAAATQEKVLGSPDPVKDYTQALTLKNIAPEQKLRGEFALAHARYRLLKHKSILHTETDAIRAGFEAALAAPNLSQESRIKAYEAIADVHVSKGNFAAAGQQYQKILALPDIAPAQRAVFVFRALTEYNKAAAAASTLAEVNRLIPQHIAAQDSATSKASARNLGAEILIKQNDLAGAVRLWTETANASELPTDRRVAALRQVGKLHRQQKNYPAAFAAADQIGALSQTSWDRFYRTEERAAVFAGQKEEPKLRAEWLTYIAGSDVRPQDKALAWLRVASSFKAQRGASADGALLSGEKQAYEAAWLTGGAQLETRHNALMSRTQIDVDAKNYESATALLNEAVKLVDTFKEPEHEKGALKRSIWMALAQVARADKQYVKALASLMAAQQFSAWGDREPAEATVSLYREAFSAKDWEASRVILLALQNVWGATKKQYTYSIAEVEINAQNWTAAKKALDDFDALQPTPVEKTEAGKLRAKLPAGN